MADEKAVQSLLTKLSSASPSDPTTATNLTEAKRILLRLRALIPTESTSSQHLQLARSLLETGALLSIGRRDGSAFKRYYAQLQPFYELPASRYGAAHHESEGQKSKITGIYLLLLLIEGDYAGFHTVYEGLEAQDGYLENDKFLKYPVQLEQWLMEGAYDEVWEATKGEGLPSEEFGVFADVLINTIRKEIATCNEKAYSSIPISSAKNLLFLESEGAVVEYAKQMGWRLKDSRIYFPDQDAKEAEDKEISNSSQLLIENTIAYARGLEMIV